MHIAHSALSYQSEPGGLFSGTANLATAGGVLEGDLTAGTFS